jgi:hypothetical protein
MVVTTAAAAYGQATAKGQKTYSRKQMSERCADGTFVHSECSGTFFGFVSYIVPTQFRCPCKCHDPKVTCKRCGMTGLAWAETYKFGHAKWTLYQPLERVVNSTYRMEHRCGVDHNVIQNREGTTQDIAKAEREWVRAERLEAREAGDDRRSAALTAYSPMISDLARPGGLTFDQIVADELPADEDIQARARALYRPILNGLPQTE